MQTVLAAILLALLPFSAFATDGPGTLQDVLKNAEMKVGASQVAAWGIRDGLKEALKSLEQFPAETCVENSIMTAEALIELASASNCLRAPGFAFEYKKVKALHCKPTSMMIAKATSKALRDSIRRCMQLGYTQCEVDRMEYVPTSDGYCMIRASTRASNGADLEPQKLVRARDLLMVARDMMEGEEKCQEATKLITDAKALLVSIKFSTLPDWPNGRTPAYFCDDF